jgi:hypothetical protein
MHEGTGANSESNALPLPAHLRFAAMARSALLYIGLWLIVSPGALAITNLGSGRLKGLLYFSGIALVLIAWILGVQRVTVRTAPLGVAAPVTGRWMALNCPATRIPSHGTHFFGQTYAIDLVYVPTGEGDPETGRQRTSFRRPEEFPSYGKPIHAVADGTVARMHDGQRDHRSRSTRLGLLYFAMEAFVRGLGPPRWMLGNYLILRVHDGSHVLYAHLRRGSLRVSRGDHVVAGDYMAECGNSDNTTVPHLHVQRQDVSSVLSATGMPWSIGATDDRWAGFPKSGQVAHFATSKDASSHGVQLD